MRAALALVGVLAGVGMVLAGVVMFVGVAGVLIIAGAGLTAACLLLVDTGGGNAK